MTDTLEIKNRGLKILSDRFMSNIPDDHFLTGSWARNTLCVNQTTYAKLKAAPSAEECLKLVKALKEWKPKKEG